MTKKIELMTKDQAIAKASELRNMYPKLATVEDVIDKAIADGKLQKDENTIIVWGRLNRLLPNRIQSNGIAKCDICGEDDQILSAKEKDSYRSDYAGIDFYNEICNPCWNNELDVR